MATGELTAGAGRCAGGRRGRPMAPPSLWRLLEARVPPAERPAVRRLLGDEAVERSLELHAEVSVLQELRRERRAAAPEDALLAAPPRLRELVRGEIRLLLRGLRRRAAREGRDGEAAVAAYSPRVLGFAAEVTAGAGPGALPPGSAAPSRAAALAQHLDAIAEQLNVARLPEVLLQLRSLLAEECRELENHVTHLQRCLEQEHYAAAGPRAPEPTLAELQDQRRAMEQDLQRGPARPCASLSPDRKDPEQLPRSPRLPSSPMGAAAGPATWAPLSPSAARGPAEESGPGAWGQAALCAPHRDLSALPPRWPPTRPGAVGHRPPFLPSPPSVLPPPRSALGRHRRLLPCKGLS